MAERSGASGLVPIKKSSSFVTFFPKHDPTICPTTTDEANHNGIMPETISWNNLLAVHRPRTRQPAWCRVPTVAHASSNRKGMIMKRIGLYQRHQPAPRESTLARGAARDRAYDSDVETIRRKRVKAATASDEIHEIPSQPISQAEVASLYLKAKVDVANYYLSVAGLLNLSGSSDLLPSKRRNSTWESRQTLTRSRPIEVIQILKPIISKALLDETEQIDYSTASIAESTANLNELRPDPRSYVARRGIPDLSDIKDVSDSEDSCISTKTSWYMSGPRKTFHAPSHTSSAASSRDNSPVTSPKPHPHADSTETDNAHVGGETTLYMPSPRKVFKAPSYSPSPESSPDASPERRITYRKRLSVSSLATINERLSGSTTPVELFTPPQYSRPDAPTPSKWNRTDSDAPTPVSVPTSTLVSQNASPTVNPSPLLPPFVPQNVPARRESLHRVIDLDFGATSPSFTASVSGRDPIEEAIESRRTTAADRARRRRSEPLLRSCLKKRAARQTISPQKLRFGEPLAGNEEPATPAGKRQNTATDESDVSFVSENSTPAVTPLHSNNSTTTITDKTPGPEHWGLLVNKKTQTTQYVPETPVKSRDVVTIDMHRTQNIWGKSNDSSLGSRVLETPQDMHKTNTAVQHLANMVEDHCDGQAKVMVSQENGRLVVRFKLSAEHAHLFPASQGADESNFTTTPSIVSRSPPITLVGHSASAPAEDLTSPSSVIEQTTLLTDSSLPSFTNFSVHSRDPTHILDDPTTGYTGVVTYSMVASPGSPRNRAEETDMPSTPVCEDNTLIIPDFAPTPVAEIRPSLATSTASPETTCQESVVSLSSLVTHDSTSQIDPDGDDAVTDASPLQDLGSTELDHRPTVGLVETVEASAGAPPLEQQSSARESSPSFIRADILTQVEEEEANTIADTDFGTPVGESTFDIVTSFTPVNKTAPKPSADDKPSNDETTHIEETPTPPIATISYDPIRRPRQQHDDDSPGRDYMRDFIKRSKPKRLSTMDNGSPIAPPTKRLPLGAKSPNTPSPLKTKRKTYGDRKQAHSPSDKATSEPALKKVRRMPKKAKDGIEDEDDVLATFAAVTRNADDIEQEDDELMDDAATRRSSRIRGQIKPLAVKSSIPTPIKIGGRSGAGLGTGAPSKTTAQQSLTKETSVNTRRNRGEQPMDVLARISEELSDDSEEQLVEATAIKKGKSVGWRTPLESFQDEQPKKTRTTMKTKTTFSSSTTTTTTTTTTGAGVTKKTLPKATPQKPRHSKVTEKLGMTGNGTPARPKRVTRSKTRTLE